LKLVGIALLLLTLSACTPRDDVEVSLDSTAGFKFAICDQGAEFSRFRVDQIANGEQSTVWATSGDKAQRSPAVITLGATPDSWTEDQPLIPMSLEADAIYFIGLADDGQSWGAQFALSDIPDTGWLAADGSTHEEAC
jgi:hypothetical protein